MTSPWLLDPTITFLNHGSFGSCPRPVLEHQSRLREQLEREPVDFLIRRFEPKLDEARERIARLVGAQAEDLALLNNASTAVNSVLASIPFERDDEIIVLDHGYPAVNNAAKRWIERAGGRLVIAHLPFPLSGPEEVVAAVEGALTPKTRLVIVDHVTSPTALVLPVERVVNVCREKGVDVFVDGAHAPGMLDLKLDEIGAAYSTGNLHKWVCAPKGAAYLHVRRDRRDIVKPLVTSHGMSSQRTDRSRYWLEFDWTGTDDPTAVLSVGAALDFLETVHPDGLAGVRRANHELVVAGRKVLMERLGIGAPCPESMLGSMASLPLPADPAVAPETLHDRLIDEYRVQVPVFPFPGAADRTLRISAQKYNGLAQYETLAQAVSSELRRSPD